METFDHFPAIFKPDDSKVNMLDCKINVTDMSTPIKLSLFISELKRFYYEDIFMIDYRLVKHIKVMMAKGLVQNDAG